MYLVLKDGFKELIVRKIIGKGSIIILLVTGPA